MKLNALLLITSKLFTQARLQLQIIPHFRPKNKWGNHCQAEYKKVLGKETPTTIIGGGIYLAWYFPDAGIEASKYPQKGICYIWKWDSKRIYGDAAYAQVVTSALARN